MSAAPPLSEGEEVVFDHIPSLGAFKRAALMLLCVSLLPTVAFAIVFPDTYWVIAPMFLACMLLTQERFKLGRHRAWITNQRVVTHTGAIDLANVDTIKRSWGAVRLGTRDAGKTVTLAYPKDREALIHAIETAKQDKS